MPFIKADIEEERKRIKELCKNSSEAEEALLEFNMQYEIRRQLIEARKQMNLTQSELAERIKVPQQSVSRFERGTGGNLGFLVKYLRGIGYTIELKKN
jgi:DNA-binding XRE family transcriptional regulator